MIINILTFSKVYNRGANLQAYALKHYLETRGCDVYFIDLQLPTSKDISIKGRFWAWGQNIVAGHFRRRAGFKYTQHYGSTQELHNNLPYADIYIVGSDQVWNPEITGTHDFLAYFFNFLPNNVKRISYAASIGTDSWKYGRLTRQISEQLRKFTAISVREESAAAICRTEFNVNAEVVLDPTLLLREEDLLRLIGKHPIIPSETTFVYLLYTGGSTVEDTKMIHKVSGNSKLSGLNIGFISKLSTFYSIEHWLWQIACSNLIITNSFHCMVMAILLHKDFIVIPPYPGRETRITSLLNKLCLSHRYLRSRPDIKDIRNVIETKINYNEVETKLQCLREDSEKFIEQNILH
jgi:hypothetical protein